DNDFVTIKGAKFNAKFDAKTGIINSLKYGNNEVIKNGNGPKLNAIRAFVNNDVWIYQKWFKYGLHNLQPTVKSFDVKRQNNSILVRFKVDYQAPNSAKIHGGTDSGRNRIEELKNKPFDKKDLKFMTEQFYTIYADGTIDLQTAISSNKSNVILPRLGYQLKFDKTYDNITYYGRGEVDNYPDRKSGQFIGVYSSRFEKQMCNFPKPQDMGNHQDVRWASVTNKVRDGVIFVPNQPISITALPYSAIDLISAPHPYQLPKSKYNYLNLDIAINGLGGASCGQGGPLAHDQIRTGAHVMGFMIRPIRNGNFNGQANVSSAPLPIVAMSRDTYGKLTLKTFATNEKIIYKVNDEKPEKYKNLPINFKNGGQISAWFKSNPTIKSTYHFDKIEYIPLTVVYASSEEVRANGNASNLVDNNEESIWHTAYSVTVSKYPHWVDFDAGDKRTIKGFVYLPRQSGGNNGNVKEYEIYISQDGKNWGTPIIKSSFANNRDEKKVLFKKPVKARYIRFTALSAQNEQDFASGSEFRIIAE
ncbi:MAG: beta-galactosidase, partial [Paludibacter sp.]